MDINKRPNLPALSYLEKAKNEEDARQYRTAATPQNLSNSSVASPTYRFTHGAPPSYSHSHSTSASTQQPNTWSGAQPGVLPTPDARRPSEHEMGSAKPNIRQSLPSISEALGVDSQTRFVTSSAVPPPPAMLTTRLSPPQSAVPSPPSPQPQRLLPMEPSQGLPTSFSTSSSYSQYPQFRSEQVPQQSRTPSRETSRPPASYPPLHERKPSLESQAPPAPSHQMSMTSPPHEHSAPQHATGSTAPRSNFSYGYTPYPPRYSEQASPAHSAAPIYQPSTIHEGPQSAPSGWKSEAGRHQGDGSPGQANYADNVKRHLDSYDLELALNDIASASGILSDFSRRYGDRMHQTQRSGASLSTLPGNVELDDMISKSRVQLDSLMKIRDIVRAQQVAYEQQVADQRHQHKAYVEAPPPLLDHHSQQSQPPPLPQHDDDESKSSGYVGGDTKKRRGRTAPPGRCHSCNRAETPEWRRGPDGARTLCNACGLHYAKLTRKNNGTASNNNNNNNSSSSSNSNSNSNSNNSNSNNNNNNNNNTNNNSNSSSKNSSLASSNLRPKETLQL